MKIVVVTASIGERRGLVSPVIDRRDAGVRYVAFVDRPISHPLWETVVVERVLNDPCRDAKRYKFDPPTNKFIADGPDASIWIDRHCRLLCDPVKVFEEFHEDVGVIEHGRHCVYQEGAACRVLKKDDPEAIRRTLQRWKSEGVPRRSGLFYGGCLFRRHPGSESFSKLWREYVEFGSKRDQLSLPVALHRSGVSYRVFSRTRRPDFFKIRGK